VLLQAIHDIIGNAVAFFFRQLLAKSAHEFARERDCEAAFETRNSLVVPIWQAFPQSAVCDRRHLPPHARLRDSDCGPEEPHPPNPHPTARRWLRTSPLRGHPLLDSPKRFDTAPRRFPPPWSFEEAKLQ
jgi:hypothetical protein